MKKRICAMMATLIMMPYFCYASGIGPDKYQHVGAGAALNLGLQAAGVKKETAWCIAGAVFIGKEIYDARHRDRHTPELADIGADMIGLIASEGVIWILRKEW